MPGKPKGLPKTGGRKKGTLNKTTIQVKEAILHAFDKVGGKDYLVKVAEEDFKTFCTLLAKVLPAELNIKGEISHLHDLSDTERSTRIATLLDAGRERRTRQTTH